LLTETLVTRVLTDEAGTRAVGVEVARDGKRQVIYGGSVVLACGAVNSAALLLRSISPSHPDGLANSSGLVGRNYMQHTCSILMAVGMRRNRTKFQKTLAVNDYYFGDEAYPHSMGGIQTIGKIQADMLAVGVGRLAPKGVRSLLAGRSTDWLVMTEDIPQEANRVVLASSGKIRVSWRPTNMDSHRALVRRAKRMLHSAGYPVIVSTLLGVESNPHQCGTARFGEDPSSSVLDSLCRSRDVKGLLVVDASFFPSSSAVNPALTIAAQALRVSAQVFGASLRDLEPPPPGG
jgi:choline dehydrogenase-like flavoprotein